MKFLGKEQKVEVKTKSIRDVKYLRCDKCNKVIFPGQYLYDECKYIKVHTWHSDWGNDSIDSHRYMDLCPECACEYVSDYIKNANGSEELELENRYLCIDETLEDFDGDDDYDDKYDLVINDALTNNKGEQNE